MFGHIARPFILFDHRELRQFHQGMPTTTNDVLELRPLEAKDLTEGAFLSVLGELTTVGSVPPSVLLERLAYMRTLPDTYFPVVLVKKDGPGIIGTATLFIERKFIHECGAVGHIEDVVVSRAARGGGYGRLLVEHLTSIAQQHRCYKVILDCDDKNVAFYERCGYQRKGAQMARYFA